MVRVAGIEPASSAWKADILAFIRHPQTEVNCTIYRGGSQFRHRANLSAQLNIHIRD